MTIFAKRYKTAVWVFPDFLSFLIMQVMNVKRLILTSTNLTSKVIQLKDFQPSLLPLGTFDLLFVFHKPIFNYYCQSFAKAGKAIGLPLSAGSYSRLSCLFV